MPEPTPRPEELLAEAARAGLPAAPGPGARLAWWVPIAVRIALQLFLLWLQSRGLSAAEARALAAEALDDRRLWFGRRARRRREARERLAGFVAEARARAAAAYRLDPAGDPGVEAWVDGLARAAEGWDDRTYALLVAAAAAVPAEPDFGGPPRRPVPS